MEVAGELGEFFLRGGVLGSCGVEGGSGGAGLAAISARRRLGASGFLFLPGGLPGKIEDQEERE